MEARRIPNVFTSAYRLARHNDYDPLKWQPLLTGIHRKAKEKNGIRDLCLLYYALFKGSTRGPLESLQITYKDRETMKDLGPITISDIAEVYTQRVADLLNFMNGKQLAMISRCLLMLNKLNEGLCATIISRIGSARLKISPRSFATIASTLGESRYVSSDRVEKLLSENRHLLLDMNLLDLLCILKTVAIHNIRNKDVLSILSDKMEYYCENMEPTEVLSTLHSLHKLDWKNDRVLNALYFKTQNTIHTYNLSQLVRISRYFSHFNLPGVGHFFTRDLVPRVHELANNYILTSYDTPFSAKHGHSNYAQVDEILLFYNYCFKTGSKSFPVLLPKIVPKINHDYQWSLLLSALNNYQRNLGYTPSDLTRLSRDNNRIDMPRNNTHPIHKGAAQDTTHFSPVAEYNLKKGLEEGDLTEYTNLVKETIESFKSFLETNKVDAKYLPTLSRLIVDSGLDREDAMCEILKKIETSHERSPDHLVHTLFNLHTLDYQRFNDHYEKLLLGLLKDPRVQDHSYSLPLLTSALFRGLTIPDNFSRTIRDLLSTSDSEQPAWELSPPQNFNLNSYRRTPPDLSDEALEYLLYTIVLSGDENSTCSRVSEFRTEIVSLFKRVKKFKRKDLHKAVIYYLHSLDPNIMSQISGSKEPQSPQISLETVKGVSVPRELAHIYDKVDSLLVKVDDELAFRPVYLPPGGRQGHCPSYSRERWDTVSKLALERLLQLHGYSVSEF